MCQRAMTRKAFFQGVFRLVLWVPSGHAADVIARGRQATEMYPSLKKQLGTRTMGYERVTVCRQQSSRLGCRGGWKHAWGARGNITNKGGERARPSLREYTVRVVNWGQAHKRCRSILVLFDFLT